MKIEYMGVQISNPLGLPAQPSPCRLVIRTQEGISEILHFVNAGLEVGQQVVIVAGPTCLNGIASGLSENGLRPDVSCIADVSVFLTAPECLNELLRAGDSLQRSPLHRHGTVLRWVTDWSWALSKGDGLSVIRDYQRRLHEFVRPLNAISLCTMYCDKVGRASLLAILAEHRRATRIISSPQLDQHSARA